MRPLIVAIDGPSGAGKGTVARGVAAALGYRYVDTGAMYRAVAWKALDAGVPLTDEGAVAAIARTSALDTSDGIARLDGRDVTREIRTPEIDRAAAAVARLPAVRAALVERQRAEGGRGGLVMEGRDIGTVVFPTADVKVYLDATPQERARRRAHDPAHRAGEPAPVHEVATELEARDRSDRTREASPLAVAADATIIDTTGLPIEEVVGKVMEVVRKRLEEIDD